MSYSISVDTRSAPDPFPESITSISFSVINGSMIELSSDLSPIFALSRVSDNKPPSSNYANVIITPVPPLKYASQGMYDTAGNIAIDSA